MKIFYSVHKKRYLGIIELVFSPFKKEYSICEQLVRLLGDCGETKYVCSSYESSDNFQLDTVIVGG